MTHTYKDKPSFIKKTRDKRTLVYLCTEPNCDKRKEITETEPVKRASNMGGAFSTNWSAK